MEKLRKAYVSGKPRIEITKLENSVKAIHKQLNSRFTFEIERFSSGSGQRGSLWNNADRGMNIARGSRSGNAIAISTMEEFKAIKNLAKSSSWLGKGAIGLDAYFRYENVQDVRKQGGNWQKEAAVETTALGASAVGGILAGTGTVAVLGIVLVATPAGWALVITVGVGVIIGFLGSLAGNYVGRIVGEYAYKFGEHLNSWLLNLD